MIRPAAALTVALVALGAAAPSAAESWFTQRVTRGDVPLRVEYLWSDGPRFRAEVVVAGRPILTLVHGELYYVIDQLSQTGVAIARAPAALAADRKARRPFGHEAEQLVAEGGEKVRQERVMGRLCDVYRVTNQAGRREVWVTADGLALPIRIDTFDRATSRNARVDYVDWTRELRIAEGFFAPDPRVQLERIEYQDYVNRAGREPIGPAPVLYAPLLHGR